jgi:regulatory protein
VAGRRARTGRGWDAAPPRPRRRPTKTAATEETAEPDAPLWTPEEDGYARAKPRAERQAETRPAPESDPAEQARQICLRLLAARPRTRSELAVALRRRGIDAEVVTAVLDRYDEVGIIDDAAFARAWVTSRHHGRGLARRALGSELRQRGVDRELVGEALGEVDDETEAATARALIERKVRAASGNIPPDALLRRLVGTLARKGYPPGLAIRVVKEALAAAADDQVASYAEFLDPDAAEADAAEAEQN